MKDNLKGVSSSFIIIDNIRTQILKIDGPNAEAKYSTTVHAAIDQVQCCVSPVSLKAALVILWLPFMSLSTFLVDAAVPHYKGSATRYTLAICWTCWS